MAVYPECALCGQAFHSIEALVAHRCPLKEPKREPTNPAPAAKEDK